MAMNDISIIHHIAFILLFLWTLKFLESDHLFFYILSLIYLYQVHQRYITRLRKKLQFEERRSANQRRVLSDFETVRWLNHAVENIWPLCLEEIVSQKIFLPIVPWFLNKFKPWTVKSAAVQHLYLGRNPPVFTEMRVLHESSDDDDLVLEVGINFLTGEDMSAVLAAKLRKRVGLGIVAKMHLTGLHVEGKVLIGVKFINKWPYISRLRICFAEPPYFQMTVKPLFNHGVDVAELPGVAGWLDNLLAMVFEQTLVQPNMLVVDMEKFVVPEEDNWFSVLVKEPVTYARVEVIEATNIIPSDLNGLSDPYVKGQLGPYRFRTKIQKNTLQPKWQEEFKIPLCSWESENVLAIEVRDKDPVVDDRLGVCSVNLSNLRDGKRHDMWISLEDVKMGKMRLAITVVEANTEVTDRTSKDNKSHPCDNIDSPKQHKKVVSTYEPISVEGQNETGIWLHHPGSDAPSIWEPRKPKNTHRLDTEIFRENNVDIHTPKSSSTGSMDTDFHNDDTLDGNQMSAKKSIIQKGLQKINTTLLRNQKNQDVTTPTTPSLKAVVEEVGRIEEPTVDNSKRQMKEKAKNIFKQAGKSARQLKYALSRKGMGSKPSIDERIEKKDDQSSSSNTDEDTSLTSSLYETVGSPPVIAYPYNCRDQVPLPARDPLAAVSYYAPPCLENETLFHDAR